MFCWGGLTGSVKNMTPQVGFLPTNCELFCISVIMSCIHGYWMDLLELFRVQARSSYIVVVPTLLFVLCRVSNCRELE